MLDRLPAVLTGGRGEVERSCERVGTAKDTDDSGERLLGNRRCVRSESIRSEQDEEVQERTYWNWWALLLQEAKEDEKDEIKWKGLLLLNDTSSTSSCFLVADDVSAMGIMQYTRRWTNHRADQLYLRFRIDRSSKWIFTFL